MPQEELIRNWLPTWQWSAIRHGQLRVAITYRYPWQPTTGIYDLLATKYQSWTRFMYNPCNARSDVARHITYIPNSRTWGGL